MNLGGTSRKSDRTIEFEPRMNTNKHKSERGLRVVGRGPLSGLGRRPAEGADSFPLDPRLSTLCDPRDSFV